MHWIPRSVERLRGAALIAVGLTVPGCSSSFQPDAGPTKVLPPVNFRVIGFTPPSGGTVSFSSGLSGITGSIEVTCPDTSMVQVSAMIGCLDRGTFVTRPGARDRGAVRPRDRAIVAVVHDEQRRRLGVAGSFRYFLCVPEVRHPHLSGLQLPR